MLNENEIIHYLCEHLTTEGYEIHKTSSTIQKGIDIVAYNSNADSFLIVEVKGETSSKMKSNRFGQPFHSGQITNHVARAVLTSMKALTNKKKNEFVAMAFPNTDSHKKEVAKIKSVLEKLKIKVFFVGREIVIEK